MTVSDWANAVSLALSDIITRFIYFLPSVIGALIIVVIGWIVGIVLGTVVDRILRVIGLQTVFERARIDEILKKAGTDLDTSAVLAAIVKWIIYLVAFISATDTLRIPQVSIFLNQVLEYIPSVAAAAAILLMGVILGNFLSKVVKGSVLAAGLGHADTVSALTRYAIIIFSFLAALVQLGVATVLLQTLFTGFVAAAAIAFGLAVGLGGQTVAKDFLEKLRDALK